MLPLSGGAAAAGEDDAQLIGYQLDLRLIPEDHRLEGTATLQLPPVPIRVLRLAPHAEVLAVSAAGHELPYTFRAGQLRTATAPGDVLSELTIRYRAVFDDQLPENTVGSEDPSFGVNAFIGPQGVFLAEGVAWYPNDEGLRGRHQVRISAPAGVTAVTAGRLVDSYTAGGLTVSTWDNHVPAQGLALAAGSFEVADADLDGIQLLTFLSPRNAGLAPAYLAAMRRHLAFYRDLIGPYPYPKFAVVENFLPTGYGLPSWTLLGNSVVRLPFILDTSLPHEIIHSWWGNAVKVDYARGNWAEGLTTYLADYLLKERADPQESREYRRKILRDYAALVSPEQDFPLTAFTGRAARYQQAIGYGKGAMVFHMLRGVIGDDAFWSGLRRMAEEGCGGSLAWSDLERIFGAAAGRDLRWFFRQWLERPGGPTLAFTGVRTEQLVGSWRVSGTIVQNEPAYRLALELVLSDASGAVGRQTFAVSGAHTPFSMECRQAPRQLAGDPDSHLFRRLDRAELPATINDLMTAQRPLVIVAAGQDALHDASRDLLKGLHWDRAEIVGESRVDAETLDGRDVLLLGWPRRPELRPALPESLEVVAAEPPEWVLPGGRRDGDALFAVLAGRQQAGASRALLLARSPAAAAAIAAKVSHYGRYSLLLFDNGRNLVKNTWEAPASPLQVVFPLESPP